MDNRRIINVSNRLPVKICLAAGEWTFRPSEGGLATGLKSVFSNRDNLWIGWPGAPVPEESRQYITEQLSRQSLSPIYLSQEEIANFYEGFSNDTLWPLFHYFPTYSKYDIHYWESYVAVNKKFADAVVQAATPDDIIWVHDYQLMLVPAMVREMMPNATIGFFQHIPFPDYEIFRALPWKKELINGLLGADVIGFQTESDVKHFLGTACKLLRKLHDNGSELTVGNRTITVQAFPISIDYSRFRQLAAEQATEDHMRRIKTMTGTQIALSVDRLDYSKGILQRLQAYELFLETHPEWRQKITLVHLVVPSRDNVPAYRKLKDEMDRLISQINGTYAVFGWQPILHFYQSFTPNMLAALYKSADMAIITPLRDGMNLVSKEYIATNVAMDGVLLLGEAAGAAAELTDAIILNPNDINDFADKICEGLNMSPSEKRSRMQRMQQVIARSDIFQWAEKFTKRMVESINRKGRRARGTVSLVSMDNSIELPKMPVAV